MQSQSGAQLVHLVCICHQSSKGKVKEILLSLILPRVLGPVLVVNDSPPDKSSSRTEPRFVTDLSKSLPIVNMKISSPDSDLAPKL